MSVLEHPPVAHVAPAIGLADVAVCRPSGAQLRRARQQLRAKAVFIALLAIGSYLGLIFVATGPLLAVPLAALLVVALIAVGTGVMHDANHGAFGRSKALNHTLGYSADLLGASSWLWRLKHNNLHHGNTNVVGIDTDIEQMPFARLAPAQEWKPWHRYQHIYMWGLYGFLTIQWMLFSDFASLITRKIGSQPMQRPPRTRDVALLVAGKVIHIGWAVVLPLMFHRWWVVLTFYVVCSWLVGFVLAVFFQVAHCVDTTEFADASAPRRGDDFVMHQLRTTADVECHTPVIGQLTAWLMGGLHHQIEHHLAPGLPHTSYDAMSARLRSACSEHDVTYRVHSSMGAALRSHQRWLRTMGRPITSDALR